MKNGELIDVSEQNKYLKSFNKEKKEVIKSKILGIIKKDDAIEYKVYQIKAAKTENKYLFSGSPQHRLLILDLDNEYKWYTLDELNKQQIEFFNTKQSFRYHNAITEDGPILIRIDKTNNTIPIVDVQMENGCYFSEGILSHNTGGNALKFYASMRLDIRRTGSVKDSKEGITGNSTKVKVVKNKCAPPYKEAEFNIAFGKGIDKELELIELALQDKILDKSGPGWYKYEGNNVAQGLANCTNWLNENPEIKEKIRLEVLSNRGME